MEVPVGEAGGSHRNIIFIFSILRMIFLIFFCCFLVVYMLQQSPPSPRSSLSSFLSFSSPVARTYDDAGKKIHQSNYDYIFPSDPPYSQTAFFFFGGDLAKVENDLISHDYLVALAPLSHPAVFKSTQQRKPLECAQIGRAIGGVINDLRLLADEFVVPPFKDAVVVIEGGLIGCLAQFPSVQTLFVVFNGTEVGDGLLSPSLHPHSHISSLNFIGPVSPSSSPNSLLYQAKQTYPEATEFTAPAHQAIKEIFRLSQSLTNRA